MLEVQCVPTNLKITVIDVMDCKFTILLVLTSPVIKMVRFCDIVTFRFYDVLIQILNTGCSYVSDFSWKVPINLLKQRIK